MTKVETYYFHFVKFLVYFQSLKMQKLLKGLHEELILQHIKDKATLLTKNFDAFSHLMKIRKLSD